MAIEVAAQGRNNIVDLRAHHVAELAISVSTAGNGVDRALWGAGSEREDFEAVPGIDALGRH